MEVMEVMEVMEMVALAIINHDMGLRLLGRLTAMDLADVYIM